MQINKREKLANYMGGGEEDKMILAFFDPVCRGIFGYQFTEALSLSEPLNKILKLCPPLMRTTSLLHFTSQSTGSQELPVLTYLLSLTNPTAPASHTVGGRCHIEGFSESLLGDAPSKDAYRSDTCSDVLRNNSSIPLPHPEVAYCRGWIGK